MARKKTWREKLADDKDLPKVITLTGAAVKKWGGHSLVVPAPREIDALMKQVPKRKLATTNTLRQTVAAQHQVDTGCPITTGIFAWIAAHAAEEAVDEGAKRVTPYWRTLKANGELNPKFPGGIDQQRQRLEAEGHEVIQKGKRFFVKDYERKLHTFAAAEPAHPHAS